MSKHVQASAEVGEETYLVGSDGETVWIEDSEGRDGEGRLVSLGGGMLRIRACNWALPDHVFSALETALEQAYAAESAGEP